MSVKETYKYEELVFDQVATSSDDESGSSFYSLETELEKEDVLDWASDYFSTGCNCAHDCCGHWFTQSVHVYQKYRKDEDWNTNTYIIEVNASRNI